MAHRKTLSALEQFLRDRLASHPLPGPDAQRRFSPRPSRKGWDPAHVPDEAKRAAALILLYPGADGLSIPLTVRRDDLPHHPGQISLPGGGVDAGEEPADAALREAHEEIGLDPRDVRIVGALSSIWVLVSGFVVEPFIGVAEHRPAFAPAEREVAKLLEVPLAHLCDAARLRWGRRTREGFLIDVPYFDLDDHHVWGATAMMLGEFASLFDASFGPGEPGAADFSNLKL